MTRRHHGVFSLVLMFLAIMVGIISIMQSSAFWAVIYLGLSIISLVVIIYSFCSKCPCREHSCGHVVFGKLTKLLPARVEGNYSVMDLAGVMVPLSVIIIFPQFWLRGNVLLIVLFWVLLIIACLDITVKVCRGCGNTYCPVNRKSV